MQMDAVTYPDEKVSQFISENLVPLRVLFNAQPLATDFNLKWTPTLITLDAEGKEHHRILGYLDPDELIPSLLLGIGKMHFETENFKEAIAKFDEIINDYAKSDSAPEAVYLRGVSKYKDTQDASHLKLAYQFLNENYPNSEWTKRAYPYRLL